MHHFLVLGGLSLFAGQTPPSKLLLSCTVIDPVMPASQDASRIELLHTPSGLRLELTSPKGLRHAYQMDGEVPFGLEEQFELPKMGECDRVLENSHTGYVVKAYCAGTKITFHYSCAEYPENKS